ncbi:MAG: riboflavin kinase [Patescibacteria group bacterium]
MMYRGEVVHGKGRGTRIGFPTLNFKIPDPFPYEHGIYAGWVSAGDRRYEAVFHYGPIPMFHESDPSLEAFLLDGVMLQKHSEISIEFIKKLREIKMFRTVHELTEQIGADIQEAKKALNS